jgi:predicted amidohydrolase YtcJ
MISKIFFNGPIITMDYNLPSAEAVGIQADKIIALGTLEEVKVQIGSEHSLVDLKGYTLLPGFIDCHLHPILFVFYQVSPDVSEVTSLQELQKALKEAVKGKPTDKLIIALNLSEEKLENPILPTKWDLDEACPDHPVFVLRYDGHIGIANSKALKLAGIDENTPIPEGGEIRRDESGELSGIISETAVSPILSKVSFPAGKELSEAATKAFNYLASQGLTSLHGILHSDAGGEFGDFGVVEIPLLKSIQSKIYQNWYVMVNSDKPKKLNRLKKPPLDGGNIESQFKLGCYKLFLDGTFGAKTACMFEPFTDEPGTCGFCVVEIDDIYEKMKIAHEEGFQICIHAIGDKGNRIAVDLYKRLLLESPRENHRHRIEHASMLTKDVLEDMAKYNIIASCQPQFINSEYGWLEKRLGRERCKYTYPMKSILDAGVLLISGSDCPVEDPSVIMGLHALVNRNDFVPEERITMKEALKTFTIDAAYGSFEEDLKGSIKIGKFADLVILNKNPLEISFDKIKELQVMETIIRGKTVFKKKE